MSLTMRTREMTRQGSSWGVTIPVIRDTQLFDSSFSLVDVPVDPQFRPSLRLYDIDVSTLPQVLVRVYAYDPTPLRSSPDRLLFEFTPSFSRGYPGMSVSYLWSIPNPPATGRLRVEVIPLDGRKDYWGFVSVTNNVTQEVTIISP